MKKVVFILIISFFAFQSIYSQNIKVETAYLSSINKQNDKFLIKDNLRNAEIVADSLLLDSLISLEKADFFYQLAQSYYLVKDYYMSTYTVFRQMLLFPDPKVDENSELLLNKNLLSKSKLRKQYNSIEFEFNNELKNYKQKLQFLMAIAFKLDNKNVNEQIWSLINVFNTFDFGEKPLWLQKWIILNFLEISLKKQQDIIHINKKTSISEYETLDEIISDLDLKKKHLKRLKNYKLD